MAHFILEYSVNLPRDTLDLQTLFAKLHHTAAESGVFPLAGIRSRAVCCEDFRVADGDPAMAFVHLSMKVGAGRDIETRKRMGEELFVVLTSHLQAISEQRYLAISFEMRELAEVKFNKNNIREKFR